MRPLVIITAFTVLIHCSAMAGQEVGEWGPDEEMCAISRLVFTDDGRHEARVMQEGSWQTLASASYQRDGNLLTIENSDVTEEVRVLEESSDHLVLQNTNPEQQRITGQDQVELVRCADAG